MIIGGVEIPRYTVNIITENSKSIIYAGDSIQEAFYYQNNAFRINANKKPNIHFDVTIYDSNIDRVIKELNYPNDMV